MNILFLGAVAIILPLATAFVNLLIFLNSNDTPCQSAQDVNKSDNLHIMSTKILVTALDTKHKSQNSEVMNRQDILAAQSLLLKLIRDVDDKVLELPSQVTTVNP